MEATHLIGRILFGGYFLYNGINHFLNRAALVQYAGAKHVPQPRVAVEASGALLLAGGASIITGWQPKLGAAALVTFLAGVTPVMHDYWRQEDGAQRLNEMTHFLKNVALTGAALSLMGTGEPWPLSLGERKRSLVDRAVESARALIPV